MTAHCMSQWSFDDPITDTEIDSVAAAVEANSLRAPMCFYISGPLDSFVYYTGMLIHKNDGQPVSREVIEAFVPENTERREKVISFFIKVLQRLKLFVEPPS